MPRKPHNPILSAVEDAIAWSNGQHESHGQPHPAVPIYPPSGNTGDD